MGHLAEARCSHSELRPSTFMCSAAACIQTYHSFTCSRVTPHLFVLLLAVIDVNCAVRRYPRWHFGVCPHLSPEGCGLFLFAVTQARFRLVVDFESQPQPMLHDGPSKFPCPLAGAKADTYGLNLSAQANCVPAPNKRGSVVSSGLE